MNKGNVVSDVFETLGSMAKGTAKQAASDAKKMGEDVAVELGLKTAANPSQDDKAAAPAHTEEQYQKIDKASKQRAAAKYQQIQEEIRQLQMKRNQEEQAYSAGPAGQKAETTMVKQLEVAQQPKAKLEKTQAEMEKEREKQLPLPAKQASRKTEMFRGASG
jgi:hypothetical protein